MRLAPGSALLTLALVGCGGGDSNDPGDLFPQVAGAYEIAGEFDDLPSSQAHFEGTLNLVQASTASGDLEGSLDVLVTIGTDIFSLSDDALESGSVSPTGEITFTAGDPSGTWTFSGTATGGLIIDGSHTLSDGTNSFSGSWHADPAPSPQVARVAPAHVTDLVRRLLHR